MSVRSVFENNMGKPKNNRKANKGKAPMGRGGAPAAPKEKAAGAPPGGPSGDKGVGGEAADVALNDQGVAVPRGTTEAKGTLESVEPPGSAEGRKASAKVPPTHR